MHALRYKGRSSDAALAWALLTVGFEARLRGTMSALGQAAEAAMTALVGEAGVTEDAAIMISQCARATRTLERPAFPSGALFGAEPADHAAALLRLAPDAAK